VITEWLRRYQRAGVPMYLVLPKDPSAQPIVLPEVITAGLVLDALDQAHGPTG
jgi:thiol:disulfide interchange protein